MGYSPWGCKQSNTTEHAHIAWHISSVYVPIPISQFIPSAPFPLGTQRVLSAVYILIPVSLWRPGHNNPHLLTQHLHHTESPPFAAADTSAVLLLPSSAQLALASCSQPASPFEEIPSGSKIAANFCDMGEEAELLPRVCLVVLMLSAVTHAAANHHINRLSRNYHLG